MTIIAWGEGKITGYNERVEEVMTAIGDREIYHVKDLTTVGYPRPPRNWSYL
ncbi:hypothetical protein GCM10011351_29020 [Paraliobacillus quinghaiensis]|uniref:Uncharacterized protein n=1 Tax=Paraliobacillus quinghaiensis TaxID=470815 RepID=A0A917TWP6_9BACI|nr:hypothetical protein [Paraliobacillus quinghaiensis]GGM41001.1 hypothetical protein GCM10011351_29020 [Paraliobacillus quinghaiensis]